MSYRYRGYRPALWTKNPVVNAFLVYDIIVFFLGRPMALCLRLARFTMLSIITTITERRRP